MEEWTKKHAWQLYLFLLGPTGPSTIMSHLPQTTAGAAPGNGRSPAPKWVAKAKVPGGECYKWAKKGKGQSKGSWLLPHFDDTTSTGSDDANAARENRAAAARDLQAQRAQARKNAAAAKDSFREYLQQKEEEVEALVAELIEPVHSSRSSNATPNATSGEEEEEDKEDEEKEEEKEEEDDMNNNNNNSSSVIVKKRKLIWMAPYSQVCPSIFVHLLIHVSCGRGLGLPEVRNSVTDR